uniref:G-protein coupled receptors family 3 profile domain-containing protein n=1 Tax=Oryctolagus cuniculus TaxID=9986 RepID=G1TSI7_RABIT
CRFYSSNYQYVLAFVFAIEEINRNPYLLPNISLGFDLYNALHSEKRTLESCLMWLSGLGKVIPNYSCVREGKSVAVTVGTTWAISAQMGTILELYKYPQLTYGSFDPILSDRSQFPSIYQMAPRNTALALGMVRLMLHFGWTWVGLAISEDMKGIQFLWDLTGEMDKNGICVAFVEMIPITERAYSSLAWQYHYRIRDSSANVVVIYGDSDSLLGLSFSKWNILMTGKVWITTSQWDFVFSERYSLLDSFHGTLTFSQSHKEIPGFKQFLQGVNPAKYPQDFYLTDCGKLESCPPNVSLESLPLHTFDMTTSDGSYLVYNAVHAVAQTLHELLFHLSEMQSPGHGEKPVVHPWQLHSILKRVQFNNSAGDQIILDQQATPVEEYDILNFWNFPDGLGLQVKVGHFVPLAPRDQDFSIHEELIDWAFEFQETPRSLCSKNCGPGFRQSPQEGKAACCFECTPCPEREISNDTDMKQCIKCLDDQYPNSKRDHCLPKVVTFLAYEDPVGMVLACAALSLSILTAVVLGVFVKHRDTPIVKVNNRTLSYILLLSLILCFLCPLLFIGQPNTATCILQQMTFGVLFTVAVSTVLAKTVTVVLAFKTTTPGMKMRQWLLSGAPNSIIPLCSLVQVTFGVVWMVIAPPFIDTDTHSEPTLLIMVCNKGSVIMFYIFLGYLGSLAMGSFTLAFLARSLPDTFNEAKFLTFSMLVFCSVWIPFLPVYNSTKGKFMVAVEVFSILASSAGLLVCIFAPKCYFILLKSERNILPGSRSKATSR